MDYIASYRVARGNKFAQNFATGPSHAHFSKRQQGTTSTIKSPHRVRNQSLEAKALFFLKRHLLIVQEENSKAAACSSMLVDAASPRSHRRRQQHESGTFLCELVLDSHLERCPELLRQHENTASIAASSAITLPFFRKLANILALVQQLVVWRDYATLSL